MGDFMSLVLNSSGGGSVTLQEPSTASNLTATLPAATGTVMVSGNMPAFSAYANANQALAQATFVKGAFQIEEFDTNNNFDNATNYRFQPTIAGYYQFTAAVNLSLASSSGVAIVSFFKNGSEFKRSNQIPNVVGNTQPIGAALIYLNGSTDYVECYFFQNSGSSINTANGANQVYFQGFLARTA